MKQTKLAEIESLVEGFVSAANKGKKERLAAISQFCRIMSLLILLILFACRDTSAPSIQDEIRPGKWIIHISTAAHLWIVVPIAGKRVGTIALTHITFSGMYASFLFEIFSGEFMLSSICSFIRKLYFLTLQYLVKRFLSFSIASAELAYTSASSCY